MSLMRHISVAVLLLAGLSVGAAEAADPTAPAPQAAQAPPSGKPTGIDAVLCSVKTSGDDFLPPDQAFRLDALASGSDSVRLNWEIADGYYLYRTRIKVSTSSPGAQLGGGEPEPVARGSRVQGEGRFPGRAEP